MPEIAYLKYGKGLPLVLLPGFGETKEIWTDFARPLADSYEVWCPDLPGFGESKAPGEGFTLQTVAQSLGQWLLNQNIPNACLLGHSLGGYLVLEMATLSNLSLSAIGLFHSTAFPDTPMKKETRNQTVAFLDKHGVAPFIRSFVPPLFSAENRDSCQQEIQNLISRGILHSKESLIGYTRAMRDRADHMATLREFSKPKLMICGDQDPAVPLDASLKHQEAVTDFNILENCGHMGMFEKQNESQILIKNFLKGLSVNM
ncbi:alpha/beta fold hydrolase [Cyclobacterium jeungdonense]|uniref:Alpha/beta hydrolase n=1 Tax=Cyclobacterium jeungdonense TaxID=708087 RepID=A0ABT8CBS9_9BACT|nr:alpha/beta hydrolase [Cyclobacterium jeungdonense]MDN3689617.1 alpha/beta hydrolase [Cyclobacterium jeungdonense]